MNNSQETMDDMDVITFCKVFEVLTPFPDAVQNLDKWGSPYKSQKAHVVNWFASQKTTGSGAYTRQVGNSSARTCYNRLLNPGMLIWMAAVLGADEGKIEHATAAAIEAEKINYRKRCTAFRELFPFEEILRLIGKPEHWQYDPALTGLYSAGADNIPHPVKVKERQYRRILREELEI